MLGTVWLIRYSCKYSAFIISNTFHPELCYQIKYALCLRADFQYTFAYTLKRKFVIKRKSCRTIPVTSRKIFVIRGNLYHLTGKFQQILTVVSGLEEKKHA